MKHYSKTCRIFVNKILLLPYYEYKNMEKSNNLLSQRVCTMKRKRLKGD